MNRKEPKLTTIKALFAKSGNLCAFPDCTHPLVDDRNLFIAEVCHIHAVRKRDARFDSSLTDEQLRSYENLILLCHAHHKRIDYYETEFSAAILKRMKKTHEKRFAQIKFDVSNQVLAEALLQVIEPTWTPPLDQVFEQLAEILDSGKGMNFTSANMCFVKEAQLMFLYYQLMQNLPLMRKLTLQKEQQKWRVMRQTKAHKARKKFEGGTMAQLVSNTTYLNLTEKRIAILHKRLRCYSADRVAND